MAASSAIRAGPVLERRFPKLLGDASLPRSSWPTRKKPPNAVLTSEAMIDQTIEEAADRIEQVPVNEAFNWGRRRPMVWPSSA